VTSVWKERLICRVVEKSYYHYWEWTRYNINMRSPHMKFIIRSNTLSHKSVSQWGSCSSSRQKGKPTPLVLKKISRALRLPVNARRTPQIGYVFGIVIPEKAMIPMLVVVSSRYQDTPQLQRLNFWFHRDRTFSLVLLILTIYICGGRIDRNE